MTKKILTQIVEKDKNLIQEVQPSLKLYMRQECSLKELEELDNKFILTNSDEQSENSPMHDII